MTTTHTGTTMTASAYREALGTNASALIRLIRGTPAHYRAYLENREEPSEAQELGTAIHAAILEPEHFAVSYLQKPDGMSFATKEGKAWREWNKAKTILAHEDYNTCTRMAAAIGNNSWLCEVIEEGEIEKSFFWTDKESGLPCKARPDIIYGDTIYDIKTTENASPSAFTKSIAAFAYNYQAAFYLKGLRACGRDVNRFVFVAIEKNQPHAVAMYEITAADLAFSEAQINNGLATIRQCMQGDTWPAYSSEVVTVGLPAWAFQGSST